MSERELITTAFTGATMRAEVVRLDDITREELERVFRAAWHVALEYGRLNLTVDDDNPPNAEQVMDDLAEAVYEVQKRLNTVEREFKL